MDVHRVDALPERSIVSATVGVFTYTGFPTTSAPCCGSDRQRPEITLPGSEVSNFL